MRSFCISLSQFLSSSFGGCFLDPAIFLQRSDIISHYCLFLTLACARSGLKFAAAANFDFSFALKKSMVTDGMHVIPAQVSSSPRHSSFLEQECPPTFSLDRNHPFKERDPFIHRCTYAPGSLRGGSLTTLCAENGCARCARAWELEWRRHVQVRGDRQGQEHLSRRHQAGPARARNPGPNFRRAACNCHILSAEGAFFFGGGGSDRLTWRELCRNFPL